MEKNVLRFWAVAVLSCLSVCRAAGENTKKCLARLPDGTTVELVGLRCKSASVPEDFQGDEWQWWSPEGVPLPQPPDTWTTKTSWSDAYLFAVHIRGPSDCSCVAVGPWDKDTNVYQTTHKGPAYGARDDLRLFSLHFDRGQKTGDVRLGVATGNWTLVQEWPFPRNATPDSMIYSSDKEVVLRCPVQHGADVLAEVTHGFGEEATRLVIFGADGRQHTSTTRIGGQGAGLVMYVHRFEDLTTDGIQRIEFQKRPHDHWLVFRNVSLRPGQRTQAQVEIENMRTGLTGGPLPRFNVPRIDAAVDSAKSKRILVCFWDVGQRPSRNCIQQLAKEQGSLQSKGVVVLPAHVSTPGDRPPEEWLADSRIPLTTETLDNTRAEARLIWGARVLPWLILTDANHIVMAEGFAPGELDEKLREIRRPGVVE